MTTSMPIVLSEDELRQVILALVTQDTKRVADAVVLLQDKLKGNTK